jgi:UDP-N-acetylglucosamine:LPS N-acetylglucosamine transferase
MKEITIAIACELAPAKTLIPVIKKLKSLEREGLLNWEKSKIIGLTHGTGVKELLDAYCDEIYSIGKGRGSGKVKRNTAELFYLICKDILKAISALRGKGVDLLITCGNAGDVRKAISAANILRIPIIHIEQDIYNPIETIAYSNLIIVPSEKYKKYLSDNYCIKSIENIEGYPMASYIDNYLKTGNLLEKNEIISKYEFSSYILLVLGGDLKTSDLKTLIRLIEKINFPTLIAPYRFKRELILELVNSPKIKVLEEFVDLLSLMKSAELMIYGAGMGMTIEAGVLEVPSIKIAGFHPEHGSVDLANDLNIPILEINNILEFLNKFYNKIDSENTNKIDKEYIKEQKKKREKIKSLNGNQLVKDSNIAIEKLVSIINDFDLKNPPKKSGLKSMKAIWKQRSKFR